MVSLLDKLLASDISDPTDFPDSPAVQGLRQLDDALRCHICREFYDAPVTLACGHCFCSACIRSALPQQALCPSCRKSASEVHIRKDVAMETAVQAWQLARSHILRLTLEEEARKAQPPVKSPRSRRKRSISPEQTGQKRRRYYSPPSAHETIVLSSGPSVSGSSTPNALPDLVQCPVCSKNVPSQTINMHLDSNCKRYLFEAPPSTTANGSKNHQKEQWSRFFPGGGTGLAVHVKAKDKERGKGKGRATPERDEELEHQLPKVAYDIHPQKRIAAMLVEWGLPTNGDKAALIRRHERWIVLYNANLDRAPTHRRSVDQLRADLRKLEEAEGKTRKEAVDDPIAYQRANKAAFAKLMEAARPKNPSAQESRKARPPSPDKGDHDVFASEESS